MHLILICISGLVFSMVSAKASQSDDTHTSDFRHFMGLYKPPKASSLSLKLSSFELNLINEMIIDIAISECANIHPIEVYDIKSYISEQIAAAPVSAALNSQFIEVYTRLLKCSEITEGSKHRMEAEGGEAQSVLNTETKLKDHVVTSVQLEHDYKPFDINNALNKLPSLKAESMPVKTITLEMPKATNDLGLQNAEEKLQSSPIATKVSAVNEPEEIHQSGTDDIHKPSSGIKNEEISKTESGKKSEENSGFLDSVGHVFKKLYDNTANIFSWFGRKKREVSYEDDDEEDESIFKAKSTFHNQDHTEIKIQSLKPKHHHKKSHRKPKKVPSNTRIARHHFFEVFKSLNKIVLTSCPADILPLNDFIQKAIIEILWYINADLLDAASERKKLTFDVGLQKRLKSCSNTIQSY